MGSETEYDTRMVGGMIGGLAEGEDGEPCSPEGTVVTLPLAVALPPAASGERSRSEGPCACLAEVSASELWGRGGTLRLVMFCWWLGAGGSIGSEAERMAPTRDLEFVWTSLDQSLLVKSFYRCSL